MRSVTESRDVTRAVVGVEPSTYLGYGITFLVITFLVSLKRDNKNTLQSSVSDQVKCSSWLLLFYDQTQHSQSVTYTFGLVHQQKKAPDLDQHILLLYQFMNYSD